MNQALIKNVYPSLSKKEKLIMDYILEKGEGVYRMTVSELSAEVGVAASTIVRLCQNLGYTGFSDFKIDLVKNSGDQVNRLTPVVNEEDTLRMIDPRVIKQVVDLFATARSIQFYGVGTSAPIAMDTVETLKIAKRSGATTVAITSNAGSPICSEADMNLIAYSDEIRYPIEAISSRMAHIAILDAICVSLSLRSRSQTSECIQTMNKLFQPMRIHKP